MEQHKQPPIRILFTGGPGAGKSSAMATLKDRLSKRGFNVCIVPEGATSLLTNCDGYDPAWTGTHKFIELQRTFLRYQMDHEQAHLAVAALKKKRTVVLFDRGCLDGRLFTTDEEWKQVVEGVGVTEEQLHARYDMVLHMTTCADGLPGLYEYGAGSNNPARYHTPEQAKDADRLTYALYESHPQVRVVPNFTNFHDKILCVLSCIKDALDVDGLAGKRKRTELQDGTRFPQGEVPAGFPTDVDVQVFRNEITYASIDRPSECLRKRTQLRDLEQPGAAAAETVSERDALYELRTQHVPDQAGAIPAYMTRRILNAEAYEMLLQRMEEHFRIVKDAACFNWRGQYYELIRYTATGSGEDGKVLLDLEEGAEVPPWLAPRGTAPPSPSKGERPLKRHATCEMVAAVCSPTASRPLFAPLPALGSCLPQAVLPGEGVCTPPPRELKQVPSDETSRGSNSRGSKPSEDSRGSTSASTRASTPTRRRSLLDRLKFSPQVARAAAVIDARPIDLGPAAVPPSPAKGKKRPADSVAKTLFAE